MITFSDNIARKPYLGSTEIAEVWLGNIKIYPDSSPSYETRYMTFDILENGNIGFTMSTNTLQYSVDGGTRWLTANPDTNIHVYNGTKVLVKFANPVLYKENDTFLTTNGVCKFYSDCRFNVYGNVMSLIYGDDFNDYQKMSILPVMKDNYGNNVDMNHFINLFYGCDKLISAENLVLPATILKDECYNGMFKDCTSLTTAPKILPAAYVTAFSYAYMFQGCTSLTTAPVLSGTVMGKDCYQYMFQNCTSLVNAPQLPAKSLALECYRNMFNGCTSLVNAPALPATTLADNCYYGMFRGCTSLVSAPELPATTLADDCYRNMFNGCTSLVNAPSILPATTLATQCCYFMFNGCTSLTTAPELPATTLAERCYSNMFKGCTSLTTAPALPALTLANDCYSNMFNGCTSLNYIKAMFTTTPNISYTSNWLNSVASSGTFVKNSAATWNVTGVNGVPNGWTIQRASS